MSQSTPSNRIAHLALFTVMLCYAINYFVAKQVFTQINPFALLAMRSIVAVIFFVLVGWLFVKEPIKERKDYVRLFACAVFGVMVNQLFFLWGLSKTSAINSAVMMITTPIFVFLIAALLRTERFTPLKILGLVIAFIGAFMIVTQGSKFELGTETLQGDIMIMINAASYGTYLVLVKPLAIKYNPLTIIKWIFIFGSMFTIPFGIIQGALFDLPWSEISSKTYAATAYVLIFATLVTYSLNAFALKKVPSSSVGIYIYLQPVSVSILSFFLASGDINSQKLLYMLIVIGGVYLVNRQTAKQVV